MDSTGASAANDFLRIRGLVMPSRLFRVTDYGRRFHSRRTPNVVLFSGFHISLKQTIQIIPLYYKYSCCALLATLCGALGGLSAARWTGSSYKQLTTSVTSIAPRPRIIFIWKSSKRFHSLASWAGHQQRLSTHLRNPQPLRPRLRLLR